MAIERYIGGGKIFFSKYNGTGYDAEVEIGEVQSATLKITTQEADAFSKDNGIKKKVDKVVTQIDSNLTFTTQNVNKENMAMAMFGDSQTESFAIGDTLPDGKIAAAAIVIPVIIGGVNPIIEGQIKIVGVNVSGDNNPVLFVHHAFVKANGDVRDYFAEKHSTLGFDAEVVKLDTETGYFKEYLIPKV